MSKLFHCVTIEQLLRIIFKGNLCSYMHEWKLLCEHMQLHPPPHPKCHILHIISVTDTENITTINQLNSFWCQGSLNCVFANKAVHMLHYRQYINTGSTLYSATHWRYAIYIATNTWCKCKVSISVATSFSSSFVYLHYHLDYRLVSEKRIGGECWLCGYWW